jgi:hypothetical protein
MSSQLTSPKTSNYGSPVAISENLYHKSPEISDLLGVVAELLQTHREQEAIDKLRRSKAGSPWIRNALAVCQMRLGQPHPAIELLRGLVLDPNGINLRADVPATFKTNFATALLMNHNLSGCLSALNSVNEANHPAVHRLQSAIQTWRKTLSWWQRWNLLLGSEPAKPVPLDFPPGDLD